MRIIKWFISLFKKKELTAEEFGKMLSIHIAEHEAWINSPIKKDMENHYEHLLAHERMLNDKEAI